VSGDGNCLYYATAHRAGYIESSLHGDKSVGQQLRMLTLITTQKYSGMRTEEGLSQQQWEAKKLRVLQTTEWGGYLEICLLTIGIGREIVAVTNQVIHTRPCMKIFMPPSTCTRDFYSYDHTGVT